MSPDLVLDSEGQGCRKAIHDGGRTTLRVPRASAHVRGPRAAVELVKEGPPCSQKAKVRWLDGEYEGLEEWVPKVAKHCCERLTSVLCCATSTPKKRS